MKLEIRTILLMLSAAIALTTACKKTPIPSEDPQPSVVEFRTKSQAAWVKTQSEPQTKVFPYDNFGVWGMARQEADGAVYNLWGNTALAEVSRNQETNLFEPAIAAYWLRGYTYNFLAVAPYNDGGLFFSGVSTKEEQTNATSPSDRMTFTYDMSGKYTGIPANGSTPAVAPDYDFDLLGAAAQSGPVAGGRTESQSLTFYHLFSQVNIGVSFSTGLNGEAIDGRLKSIKLDDICTDATCSMYHHESTNMVHADWTCADDAATMDCEYIVSEEVTFTVKADQADATVTLKAGDQTVTKVGGEAKIDVLRGTKVKYTVEETVADGEEAEKVVGETLVHRSLTQNVSLASGETRTELHPDWSINVIPQDATKMKLYLDFEIYDNGTSDVYDDFEIGLTFPSDANPQVFNHKYNWNISIGTGAAIKFEVVDVTDWTTVDGGDISM